MKFETARKIVKFTLILSIVFCVLGLITQSTPTVSSGCVVVAIICMALTVFFAVTSLKCPYCNTRIFRNCLVVKVCPYCHRDLATGAKVKGKKRK